MAENSHDPQATVIAAIQTLLERRGESGVEVRPEATLSEELGLDSLELAELSAALEDDLGSDPYSEGLLPETVAELVGFYRS
jgi:acyl carrier protein